MSRLVLLFMYGGILASGEAECKGEAACEGQSQQDEVGLLQVVSGHSAGEARACPAQCSQPHCHSGSPAYEGWKSLEHGTCYYWCSALFRQGRFCGDGPDFKTHGSIDCHGCNAQNRSGKFADFAFVDKNLGKIDGKFFIDVAQQPSHEPLPKLVEWKVEGLHIDPKVVQRGCGKLKSGHPTFNYHLHEEWNFKDHRTSSAFDCSLENVGNHWDPTATCGPASGNPVCDEGFCNTRGVNYTCDRWKFDPFSILQYRLLSPSALAPDGVACEFGDFSGMTGPITAELDPHTKEVKQTELHDGKAAMSASFGEIYPDTLDGRPHFPCQFGTLPLQNRPRLTYDFASVHAPLDQFPKRASVLVHCGNNYEKANARFFCALLKDLK